MRVLFDTTGHKAQMMCEHTGTCVCVCVNVKKTERESTGCKLSPGEMGKWPLKHRKHGNSRGWNHERTPPLKFSKPKINNNIKKDNFTHLKSLKVLNTH